LIDLRGMEIIDRACLYGTTNEAAGWRRWSFLVDRSRRAAELCLCGDGIVLTSRRGSRTQLHKPLPSTSASPGRLARAAPLRSVFSLTGIAGPHLPAVPVASGNGVTDRLLLINSRLPRRRVDRGNLYSYSGGSSMPYVCACMSAGDNGGL
jgi:hypothetical protein